MFLLKQIHPNIPLLLMMLILFSLGLFCVALSFTYDDCSWWTDAIDLAAHCPETFIEQSLFPLGAFLVFSAVLLPAIIGQLKQINVPNSFKIFE